MEIDELKAKIAELEGELRKIKGEIKEMLLTDEEIENYEETDMSVEANYKAIAQAQLDKILRKI